MKRAISVNGLFFSYKEMAVLEDVCLEIAEGEFVAFIGPNGGGKTTLLHLLMGFLKPQKGSISLSSESIGYVPQHFRFDRLFPITVLEVVLQGRLSKAPLFGAYRREDKSRALEALEKVGMSTYAGELFAQLSGGQAQRVLLARALVSESAFLFLDEPMANIDPAAQNILYTILKSLKGTITILMVTHDLHTAIKEVDRLFCVQKRLFPLAPENVCEHFALGLYHPPLKGNAP